MKQEKRDIEMHECRAASNGQLVAYDIVLYEAVNIFLWVIVYGVIFCYRPYWHKENIYGTIKSVIKVVKLKNVKYK